MPQRCARTSCVYCKLFVSRRMGGGWWQLIPAVHPRVWKVQGVFLNNFQFQYQLFIARGKKTDILYIIMLKVKVKLRLKFFNLQCYHGQKSLGQSKCNFNSMCFTCKLCCKKQCCLLTNPCPLPPPYPIQCWKIKGIVRALTVSTLSVGWGEEGRDVQC